MDSAQKKTKIYILVGVIILMALTILSLFTGKYPLTLQSLLDGDEVSIRVFKLLRVNRVIAAIVGGFSLGVAGFVYQTVFKNPLASPDICGVASGASAGAAVGILFLGGTAFITFGAFTGAILAVVCTLALSFLDKTHNKATIVLAGISVHALAQTLLMILKLSADPEKELASIEYWIMGSLNNINRDLLHINLIIDIFCLVALFLLHRQTIMLSADEGEARLLGVNVGKLRLIILIIATLSVSCIISLTGLISFIGLLAPHIARLLTKRNCRLTMLLSGVIGGCLLTAADILAKNLASTELPVSIFTSLLGAPFLIYLVLRRREN